MYRAVYLVVFTATALLLLLLHAAPVLFVVYCSAVVDWPVPACLAAGWYVWRHCPH